MKKTIIFLVLILFMSNINYVAAQSHSFLVCDSSATVLFPDTNQIKNKLFTEINLTKRKGVNTIKNFNSNLGSINLKESDIMSLIPIVPLRIYPDTIANKFRSEIKQNDGIELWNNGYIHAWNFKRSSLCVEYGNNRAYHFKKNIESIRDTIDCLYFIYFLNNERYWYPYLAYNKDGKDVIIDKQGKEFNSVEDVIINHYGSIEKYIGLYKAETKWKPDPKCRY